MGAWVCRRALSSEEADRARAPGSRNSIRSVDAVTANVLVQCCNRMRMRGELGRGPGIAWCTVHVDVVSAWGAGGLGPVYTSNGARACPVHGAGGVERASGAMADADLGRDGTHRCTAPPHAARGKFRYHETNRSALDRRSSESDVALVSRTSRHSALDSPVCRAAPETSQTRRPPP